MGNRILFVANEAFSEENSNGRTLMNLVKDFPAEELAQFYLHGNPNKTCGTYYKVSDADVLQAFLHRKKKININRDLKHVNPKVVSNSKKNIKNYFIRNIVWKSYAWWGKNMDEFLNEFHPNIVLLQAGDAPFMYSIARRIAFKYNAKLIMLNTESYVLKKKIYSSVNEKNLWNILLMKSLKHQYKSFMMNCDYCIYSMEALEEAYQKKYPHYGRSCSLLTVSDMQILEKRGTNSNFSLLYCGNLGVGRDIALNQVAKALYEVDKNAVLDIYGKFINEDSKKLVCDNVNVFYHGFVEYSKLPEIMSKASMLLHCENTERLENLRYAFSTKIADSLASKIPFIVYASEKFPFVQYLQENDCAHIADDYNKLKDILKKCEVDIKYREKYVNNARKIAEKNHSAKVNREKFKKIIDDISNE